MDHSLNMGAEDGRRTLDIPTIGLFALVTSIGLIGVLLLATFMDIRSWTRPWSGFSISSAD
jgi:hypothetical protein